MVASPEIVSAPVLSEPAKADVVTDSEVPLKRIPTITISTYDVTGMAAEKKDEKEAVIEDVVKKGAEQVPMAKTALPSQDSQMTLNEVAMTATKEEPTLKKKKSIWGSIKKVFSRKQVA